MTDSLRIDPSPPLGSAESAAPPAVDLRTDVHTGARTYVVRSRQVRPNLPSAGCPFCPGGLEAPEPYDVRWFANRWPAMPDGRCEVVLYTPRARRDVLVARRRRARAGWSTCGPSAPPRSARAPTSTYVLVFENRGAEVGATITHPHGQIYAFDDVPELPRARARARRAASPSRATGSSPTTPGLAGLGARGAGVPVRSSCSRPTSPCPTCRRSTTPAATAWPRCSSTCSSASTGSSTPRRRTCSGSTSGRSTAASWPEARLHVEIVSPWRARGVARFVAAGELGSGSVLQPRRAGGGGEGAARCPAERRRCHRCLAVLTPSPRAQGCSQGSASNGSPTRCVGAGAMRVSELTRRSPSRT